MKNHEWNINDHNKKLIDGEIRVFSYHERTYKNKSEYEITCFYQLQAEILTQKLNEKFNKKNWLADWDYDLIDKVYKVKLKRIKNLYDRGEI